MNLDGLTMSVLARELNESLQSGQIQKLYQVDKHSLLFKVRSANQDVNLMITVGANPAVYICNPLQDLPKEPSSLCMFLRKHIEGSRITSAAMPPRRRFCTGWALFRPGRWARKGRGLFCAKSPEIGRASCRERV